MTVDRPYRTRRMPALAAAVCLLVACSAQEATVRESGPEPSASGAPAPLGQRTGTSGPPSPEPTKASGNDLPSAPATRDPATLARQLDSAAATVRDPDAAAGDVRRAAELHQLAVRALAIAPESFRRMVTGRLSRDTAMTVRGDVVAARSLRALNDPQPRLPRWRIVAPPPPRVLLGHYREAQRRTGVPWTYLAAIHLVETRMGRIRGASTAGALGPMQFIPSTWAMYGAGGDINDPRDAIHAAARLLKANGAPRDMAAALWHYNPSDDYVLAVVAHARTMQRSRWTYRGYWHWRVLYRHARGTFVLPVGYPKARPQRLVPTGAPVQAQP